MNNEGERIISGKKKERRKESKEKIMGARKEQDLKRGINSAIKGSIKVRKKEGERKEEGKISVDAKNEENI
jgi:hypothetical protein